MILDNQQHVKNQADFVDILISFDVSFYYFTNVDMLGMYVELVSIVDAA